MQCYGFSDYRQSMRQSAVPYGSPYGRIHHYGQHDYYGSVQSRCTRCQEGAHSGFHHRSSPADYMSGYKDQWYQYNRVRTDLWPQQMQMYQGLDWGGSATFSRNYWDQPPAVQNQWSQFHMEQNRMWQRGYERSSSNGMSQMDPLRGLAAMHDSCNQEEEIPRQYDPGPTHSSYREEHHHREHRKVKRVTPPPAKPSVPPLPAFSQAFGSTEIGKFAEGINRSEDLTEEMVSDAIAAHESGEDLFQEWNGDE